MNKHTTNKNTMNKNQIDSYSNVNSNVLCPCQTLAEGRASVGMLSADSHININSGDNSQSHHYVQCCQPYHSHNKIPETAEQLMRSRYSAFVLHDIEYIISTTLPAQQSLLDKPAILDWSKQTDWAGLQIVNHRAKVAKRHAQVEFKAWIDTTDGKDFHHELSTFVKVSVNKKCNKQSDEQIKNIASDKWYFIDPTIDMNVPKQQLCICGSTEKFKRCCGLFL